MTRTLVIKRAEAVGKKFEFNTELVVSSSRFNAVIQFYKSLPHSQGKYGKEDTSYNGEFGFDKFDQSVIAKGLITTYKTIDTVVQEKNNIINNNKYLCSYMTLWKPDEVDNVDGKKSQATIYVKAEPGGWDKQEGDVETKTVEIKVSRPDCITIDGKSSKMMNFTINKEAQPITLQCIKSFTDTVEVTAHADGQLFGKLLILSNNEVYKTSLQPVLIKVTDSDSNVVKEENHSAFVKKIEKAFNEQSFNQANIYGKLMPKTLVLELDTKKFKDLFFYLDNELYLKHSKMLEYCNSIEEKLALILNRDVDNNKIEQDLKEKVKSFLDILDASLSYNKARIDSFTYMKQQIKKKKFISNVIRNKPKFKEAFDKFNEAYTAYKDAPIASKLNKDGKIYLLMCYDIKSAIKSESEKYSEALGFSCVGGGTAHLLRELMQRPDNISNVIHELGHALGLKHPFDASLGKYKIKKEGVVYKDKKQSEIDLSKQEIRNCKYKIRRINKYNLNTLEDHLLYKIYRCYKQIQNILRLKNNTVDCNSYLLGTIKFYIDDVVKLEDKLTKGEFDCCGPLMTSDQLQKNVVDNEKLIKSLKESLSNAKKYKTLNNYSSQSATIENYMDYSQDLAGHTEHNMKRILFSKRQWKKMQETGFKKTYLKK